MPRRSTTSSRERVGDGDGASDGGAGGDGGSGASDSSDGDSDSSDNAGSDEAAAGSDDGDGDERRSRRANNSEVQTLREELVASRRRAEELQAEVGALEAALHEQAGLEELEELVSVVRLKDDRIAELEEALRESVRIMAERERALQHEEGRRRQVAEKVGTLEQRLASLQTSHALRCSSCRPLLARSQDLEKRLARLLAERSAHLQELASMKQEALEAAISEKDAHLALLEVSGLRTARQAEQAERLRADRRRLTERLRRETEQSVQLLQEYAPPDLAGSSSSPSPPSSRRGASPAHSPAPALIATRRPNGLPPPHAPAEVEPDSLEAASSSETTPSM